MASAIRKSLQYLGLAEVPEHEDFVDDFEYETTEAPMRETEFAAEVTPIRRTPLPPLRETPRPAARPAPPADLRRIATVHPRSWDDARLIGDAFRSGVPVVVNMEEMNDEDAKRIFDFSTGLIFGLRGSSERVTARVFLLSPEHVEISGEDTAQLRRGSQVYNYA